MGGGKNRGRRDGGREREGEENKRNREKKGKLGRHGTYHQVPQSLFSQNGPSYMQSCFGQEVQTGSISRKNFYFEVNSETNIQGCGLVLLQGQEVW